MEDNEVDYDEISSRILLNWAKKNGLNTTDINPEKIAAIAQEIGVSPERMTSYARAFLKNLMSELLPE